MHTNRREFLKLASGAMLVASMPRFSSGATVSRGRLSLGHSLYGMQTVPLIEALQYCSRLGYRNVEFVLDPGFSAEPKLLSKQARKDLRTQLSALGLPVSAFMRNLRLIGGMTQAENLDAIKEAAELAHDLAPELPSPIETILGGKPADWESAKHKMVAALGEWAQVAESADIGFLVKAHVSMAVDTPEKLAWMIEQVASPRLQVAFDYSHFEPQGISLEQSWSVLQKYTKFIHVKDTRKDGNKVVMLLPGEGVVDYAKYFRLVSDAGFSGPVVVEVSSMVFRQPGYDPFKTAAKCHAVLTQALKQAGVPVA